MYNASHITNYSIHMKIRAHICSYNIFSPFVICKNVSKNYIAAWTLAHRHKNPLNSGRIRCVSLDLWGPNSYRNLDYIFGICMINGEKNVIWTNLGKKLHANYCWNLGDFYLHTSKINGLCSTLNSKETLQNLLYFDKMKA